MTFKTPEVKVRLCEFLGEPRNDVFCATHSFVLKRGTGISCIGESDVKESRQGFRVSLLGRGRA